MRGQSGQRDLLGFQGVTGPTVTAGEARPGPRHSALEPVSSPGREGPTVCQRIPPRPSLARHRGSISAACCVRLGCPRPPWSRWQHFQVTARDTGFSVKGPDAPIFECKALICIQQKYPNVTPCCWLSRGGPGQSSPEAGCGPGAEALGVAAATPTSQGRTGPPPSVPGLCILAPGAAPFPHPAPGRAPAPGPGRCGAAPQRPPPGLSPQPSFLPGAAAARPADRAGERAWPGEVALAGAVPHFPCPSPLFSRWEKGTACFRADRPCGGPFWPTHPMDCPWPSAACLGREAGREHRSGCEFLFCSSLAV